MLHFVGNWFQENCIISTLSAFTIKGSQSGRLNINRFLELKADTSELINMEKLAFATIVIFCTLVFSSKGAVIIKMANNGEPPSATEDLRTVTILQSDDRTPNKRDSPPVLLSEQEPVQRRNAFTVNEKRPCTLCKFFTTEKPTPKQRMYYKFVEAWTLLKANLGDWRFQYCEKCIY